MPEPYQNDFSAAPPPLASNGLTDNVAGGLAYITIFPALLFLFLPPYNRRPFVRFQCCQCLFLFLASAASNILHIIPLLGTIVILLLNLVIFVLWLIAMIQAFQGKKFMIPFVGPLAEQAAAAF